MAGGEGPVSLSYSKTFSEFSVGKNKLNNRLLYTQQQFFSQLRGLSSITAALRLPAVQLPELTPADRTAFTQCVGSFISSVAQRLSQHLWRNDRSCVASLQVSAA